MTSHHVPASMVLELTIRISAAFWVTHVLVGNQAEGVSSIAMQQGGIGLLLSTLIISVPPMAAMFFQGTLGSFSPYSVFGGGAAASGRPAANGLPAGAPGNQNYVPQSQVPMGDPTGKGAGGFSPSAAPRTVASTPQVNDDLKPFQR